MTFEHNGKKIPTAPPKDPNGSAVVYGADWDEELAVGEVITTSSWITSPTGLTQVSTSFTNTTTSVTFSGGTIGVTYTVTNRISTATRTDDDKSMYIPCYNT